MLTETDRDRLAEFHGLTDNLRHRVLTVARRHQVGAYIVGRPGAGKTHTVTTTLCDDETDYVLANGRMTAAALYELIEDHPDSVLVLDDLPSLFKDRMAVTILMAACDGRAGDARHVHYAIKGKRQTAWFSGGVIGISNLRLGIDPLAEALASRLGTHEHEPTDDMLTAFMRQEATQGHWELTAEQCGAVAEFVIGECKASDSRPLRNSSPSDIPGR